MLCMVILSVIGYIVEWIVTEVTLHYYGPFATPLCKNFGHDIQVVTACCGAESRWFRSNVNFTEM